jgi:hypothetical protein
VIRTRISMSKPKYLVARMWLNWPTRELVPLYFPDEAKDGDEAKDSSAEDHPESEAKPEEPSSNL